MWWRRVTQCAALGAVLFVLVHATHAAPARVRGPETGRPDRPDPSRPASPEAKVPPPDRDADGAPDAIDNCLFTANASQADADADGLGDACDALPTDAQLHFGAETALPRPDLAFNYDHFPLNIAVAPSGTVYILLGTADPFATGPQPRNLWLLKSSDGGASWGTPVKVNGNDNVFWYTAAEMTVDDAGRIFVTYDRESTTITLARSTDGGATFTYQALTTSSTGVSSVGADGGYVVVVWDTNVNCNNSVVKQRRSTDAGVTFGTAVDARSTGNCLPEVSISHSDGKVRLTHRRESTTGKLASSTSSDHGANYASAVAVRDAALPSGRTLILPALVREGPAGTLLTGWSEDDEDALGNYTFADQYADRSTNGGTSYSTDKALTDNQSHPDATRLPGNDQWDLAAASGGEVRRVLRDGTQSGRHVYVATSSDAGATYTQRQPVRAPLFDDNERNPVVAMTADGQTIVAFERLKRSAVVASTAYVTRTYAAGSTIGEVTGLRFGLFNHTALRWDAIPGAASYDVVRGGIGTLLAAHGYGATTALACGQAAVSFNDTSVPPGRDGYYYLVRGRNGAVRGTFGSSAQDTQIGVCP